MFHNRTGEFGGGIQVGKGRSWGGVGVVVGRNVDSLYGRDGTIAGGCDAFLEFAHVRAEGGLISGGGGDAPQQRGHFRAGLCEAEDIINKEEHVLPHFVAEVLGDRQRREGHAGSCARRFIHLAEDHGGLVDHAGGLHLLVELCPFTRAFAHASEDGVPPVGMGDVVDQLLNQDGLADAGAAEKTDLAALTVGCQQVNHLDPRDEHLRVWVLLYKGGGGAVDRHAGHGVHRAAVVDRITEQIHHAPERARTNRHGDFLAGILDFDAAHEADAGIHGDGAYAAVAKMLGDFQHEVVWLIVEQRVGGAQGAEQTRAIAIGEFDVDDGAEHLIDAAAG